MHNLEFALQAILFVATEPVGLETLSNTLDTNTEAIQDGIKQLKTHLDGTGLSIVEHEGAYRLVTSPEYASIIKKFLLNEAKNELSRAALETLAIIAYRGPITKQVIEEVRGVSSETMLKNLLQRGLIHEAGTAKEPGKPKLYAVSHEFLQQFGLSDISELPAISEEDQS